MKLKNKFMPAMLFAGVVALSSCEKNEQDTLNPTLEQGAIAQILIDSAEVTSYNYSGNSVSQINYFNEESGELESFEKFLQDASGKVIKSTTHAGSNHALLTEQSYTYDSKGLLANTSTNYYSGGKIEYSAYTSFEYSAAKKLEKKSVYEGSTKDGQLKSFVTYEVLPNGNYSQEKQYVIDDEGTAKLFSTTTYSFDTNTNPFFKVAEPGTASSPNNLIAATSLIHGSKKTYEHAYSYQYNERGYPMSQAVVSPSGERVLYEYLYSN